MEATLDLASILESPTFSPSDFDHLKELAFSNPESFDRFRALVADLDGRAASDRSGDQGLKLGASYQLLGDHAAAERWLQLAPPGADRSFLLAQVHRDRGKFEEAVTEFEAAGDHGRDKLECDLERAETLLAAGRVDAAAELIEQLASAGESRTYWHCASGRLAQARGDTERAIACYERALELEEENPHALFHLANIASLHGDDDTARQLYQDCASLPYVFTNALINLAIIHEDEGNYEEAAKYLRRVIATSPDHHRAELYLKDVISATQMYYDEHEAKEQQQHDAVMDIPVTDFELSVRARNCLKKMNIFTLGDLLKISERELLAYKNFGETSLNEIKIMLAQKSLSLGQYAGEAGAGVAEAPSPPMGDPEVLVKAISSIELSVRARKCLQRLGINTVDDLVRTTEAELLSSKNFGQTSLAEIKQRLGEIGLSLRNG